MHPSDRITGTKSRLLKGRRVVLGVSGSIAAVEAVRLIHELKRHGAGVVVVMTQSAQRFVTPMSLEYASGNPVVTELTGLGEHLALVDGSPGSGDVLLLAPTTANTVAKVALGIDDTPVTSCASVALGAGVPVVLAPAMHDVMLSNPATRTRLSELREQGVLIVEPQLEEKKAKIAPPETIVDHVIRAVSPGRLTGRRVLVVSGATAEPIDPIRFLTNRSSGRMGVEVAKSAFREGATVELWHALGSVPVPGYLATTRFETVEELQALVRKAKWTGLDLVFMPAALSDFAPEASRQKITSDQKLPRLKLQRLPKVIEDVRRRAPRAVLVAFKAETEVRKLVPRARARLKSYGADLVVANTAAGFGGDTTSVVLVGRSGRLQRIRGPKTEVAAKIVEAAARLLPKKGRR